jgi:peptide/nickel transport system ATP-binding protein
VSLPIVEAADLVRDYLLPRGSLWGARGRRRALDGVSLHIAAGECVGLVGESGSGKSTLARTLLGLEAPTRGQVRLLGRDLYALPAGELRRARRHIQMVFQDPYGSLDPRHKVGRIVAEPLHLLRIGRAERDERVAQALLDVGLAAADATRYPHEFSGGQRQRIAIARALITGPDLVVADEPVSALDVSVQAQVLKLLLDLKRRRGLALLFISHDLAVVAHIADRVAVLCEGRIVEEGATAEVLRQPRHPYTRGLLAATLPADPVRARERLYAGVTPP